VCIFVYCVSLIVGFFCVMCVVCVLCLIVVPLPPGENPFAVKINIIPCSHNISRRRGELMDRISGIKL
jgi:hypothetical protein